MWNFIMLRDVKICKGIEKEKREKMCLLMNKTECDFFLVDNFPISDSIQSCYCLSDDITVVACLKHENLIS